MNGEQKEGLIKNNSFVIIKGTRGAHNETRAETTFYNSSFTGAKASVTAGTSDVELRPEAKLFPLNSSTSEIAFRKTSLNFKAPHDWLPLIAQFSAHRRRAGKREKGLAREIL